MSTFHVGGEVIVRSAQEILSTLDTNGTLNGLPFMPEMLDWCGKRIRVLRRVDKTCVGIDSPVYVYPNRRFADNDVVVLDGPRCDGRAHDGCQRACRIYWKEAWLRPAGRVETSTPPIEADLPMLRSRLKVRADEQRYFCQSTELFKATAEFPGRKKKWMAFVAWREVRRGEISPRKLARLFALWCWRYLRTHAARGRLLSGPHTKTPSVTLNLKPGDAIRIKTRDQIVDTLNARGSNRGMYICYEMTRLCGKEAEVRSRIDRIIEEESGKMRHLQDTVMLKNVRGDPVLCEECLCHGELGDCPRAELMYWREIWLERVNHGA